LSTYPQEIHDNAQRLGVCPGGYADLLDDMQRLSVLHEALERRTRIRTMMAESFIEEHASGTLRKNKRLGFCWNDQYLAERAAYEFGFEFAVIPKSRILIGAPYTEGDCHAITEAGWHIERYINLSIWKDDEYAAKYIQVELPDGTRREGIGIVVLKTTATFVPKNHVVYAIVAEYDPQQKAWREARNPA
jgi:hypothetical protein